MNKRAFSVTTLITCLTIHQAMAQTGTSTASVAPAIEAEIQQAAEYTPPTLLQTPNFIFAPEAKRAMVQTGFGTRRVDLSLNRTTEGTFSTMGTQTEAKEKRTAENQFANIRAAYGLNKNFYMGLNLDYRQDKASTETNQATLIGFGTTTQTKINESGKGLAEPEVFLGTRLRTENLTALLETGFLVSTGPKNVSSSGETNGLTGQSKATVRATVFNHVRAAYLLGGSVGYVHAMNGRQVNQVANSTDVDSDVKGGSEMNASLFGQMTDMMDLGGRLTYSRTFASERTWQARNTAPFMFNSLTNQVESSSGNEEVALEASMRLRPVAGISLIPSVYYAQLMGNLSQTQQGLSSQSKLNSQSIYGAAINARMSF